MLCLKRPITNQSGHRHLYHLVTSYQANLASHHTSNRHIGFLLACHGIGKYNKMFRYILFSSYYSTKL